MGRTETNGRTVNNCLLDCAALYLQFPLHLGEVNLGAGRGQGDKSEQLHLLQTRGGVQTCERSD